MTYMRPLLGGSLLVVALINLFWVSLFLTGFGSVIEAKYLVAHSASALFLLLSLTLLWRHSQFWPIPVVLAAILHFAVISPVTLAWLLDANFLSLWNFGSSVLRHESASAWLKFDLAMFQYLIPAYFLFMLGFIAWRGFSSLRRPSVRGQHEG
jgi:hypothetical protein